MNRIPKLRKLFDRWYAGSLELIGVLKFLQFLRLLGARAKENGWRKITGIFLRGESSKFILATFRLQFAAPGDSAPAELATAELRLAEKLSEYLRRTRVIRYSVEPGRLAFSRHRGHFCDLVLARVDADGMMVELKPYFDAGGENCELPDSRLLPAVLEEIRTIGNALRRLPEDRRAPAIAGRLQAWARREAKFNYFGRRRRLWLARRVLRSTFLFCEVLPESNGDNEAARVRGTMPDFRKFRNPGWGMMSAVGRFTADFRELDLWCQFHHAAVDGAPMRDFLCELKRDWGAAGPVRYPALPAGGLSHTDVRYIGDGIFRAQFFADFRQLLAARAWLNSRYQEQMGGKASVAGLVMWGLTRHPFFAGRKILLPVDAGPGKGGDGDRELGLLMIRPLEFSKNHRLDPLAGFLEFQCEMNQRMIQARNGLGAASEFLELCALMHPFFYHVARRLWPRALNEIIGTVGLSLLREAEMFISPLTEFQSNGFMAIGELTVPTVDGGSAAAVSVTGTREQIRHYLEAVGPLVSGMTEALGLPRNWAEAPEKIFPAAAGAAMTGAGRGLPRDGEKSMEK